MGTQSNKKTLRPMLEHGIEHVIFASRWLQAPLYLGLIVAQLIYTYKFIEELIHLIMQMQAFTEQMILVAVLTLIDITMVANLLAMVIIGGYATFVNKLNVNHQDYRPDWLDQIDPGGIKVKLAGSLIGISSIHLLRTFVEIDKVDPEKIKWQIFIHLSFIFSTILLALTEYFMAKKHQLEEHK